jgi:hypothetical protein
MPFFKATIGVSTNEKDQPTPASAVYIAAADKEAAETAFKKSSGGPLSLLMSIDEVVQIEEVNQEEIEKNCHYAEAMIAKRLVAKDYKKVFYIGSQKLC